MRSLSVGKLNEIYYLGGPKLFTTVVGNSRNKDTRQVQVGKSTTQAISTESYQARMISLKPTISLYIAAEF